MAVTENIAMSTPRTSALGSGMKSIDWIKAINLMAHSAFW
jgi:hypothetical protein